MNQKATVLVRTISLLSVLAIFIAPGPATAQTASGCSPSNSGTHFADVNGDGKADAIVVNKTGVTVRLSDGTKFLPNETWSNTPYYGSDKAGNTYVYFADVTGDGKADAIVLNPTGITVRRSDGTKFAGNENWTTEPYYGSEVYSRLNIHFADVDGDGKADAIVVNKNGITVRRSDGNKFTANERWTREAFYGEHGTFFADVDGDGKADAIVVNRRGITVRRSDGARFLPNETWTFEGYRRERNVRYYFADVDGDGKADAIMAGSSGVIVRLSDGTRFAQAIRWTRNPYAGGLGTYFYDVTGDGKADAVVVNITGVTVRRSNGAGFEANEPWTTGAYFGEVGPVCLAQ